MSRTTVSLRKAALIILALASTTAAVSLQFLPSDTLNLADAHTPLLLALLGLLTLPVATITTLELVERRAPAID